MDRYLLTDGWAYDRKDLTLVAMCENVNSKVKSDYVGEYYDDSKEELMFYFEKYNINSSLPYRDWETDRKSVV